MTPKQRTQVFDSIQAKALAHAQASPPTPSVHAAACANAYGHPIDHATARLSRGSPNVAARALGFALLVVAALLVAACAGCAVPPEAIEQARTECAALNGVAANPGNTPEVRAIATRGSLAWDQQHVTLTGDHVPGRETWPALPVEFLPPAQTAPR